MDPFSPDLSHASPIPAEVARRLALAFGLTITDVRADARDVATWHAPTDDYLLTSIEARRGLGHEAAATYVRNLRDALAE